MWLGLYLIVCGTTFSAWWFYKLSHQIFDIFNPVGNFLKKVFSKTYQIGMIFVGIMPIFFGVKLIING